MNNWNKDRKGYKETKVGWIPKEWEVKKLGGITTITRLAGYEYSKYWEEADEGDILALKGFNIGKNKIINRSFKFITNSLSLKLNRSRLQKGDVVFPCVGTIGNALVINENDKYHINQNLARITPSSTIKADYLCQFLMSRFCKKEIHRFNATTSQPNVLVGSLRQFRIPIPPLKEQEKIAQILSTADKNIQLHQDKLKLLKKQKKALMQKLLSGKTRFPEFGGEWTKEKIENIVHISYGKSQKEVLDSNGQIPIYGTSGIFQYANKALCDKPAILLGRKGTIDNPILVMTPFWAIDTTFYLVPLSLIDLRWLFQRLSLVSWRRYNEASGVPSLNRKTISQIKIPLPTLPEQRKIAEVLSTADQHIQHVQQKIDLLIQQKKGLMQRLLSGSVRVNS